MTSRKTSKQRRVDETLQRLEEGDTLIVTELSRLRRNTAEIIALVNELVKRGIRLIALKQNIDLGSCQHDMSSKIIVTVFSLLAELERDLISMRTKEALSAKKSQGVTLGKPKGTIQKSKFDVDLPCIKELLSLGLSVFVVPALGIGVASWGDKQAGYGTSHTHEDILQTYRMCLDTGLTFFDTAEPYPASERLLGECRKIDHRPILIVSKFAPPLTRFSRKRSLLDALD